MEVDMTVIIILLISLFWIVIGLINILKKNDSNKIINGVFIGIGILLILFMRIDVGIENNDTHSFGNAHDERYVQTIDEYVTNHPLPGMIIGIIDGEGQHLYAYGPEDSSEAVTKMTNFEIGSLSKVMTGAMISYHLESGDYALKDTISNHLNHSTGSIGDITIEELLTHSSGLPRLPESFGFTFRALFSNFFGGNPYKNYTIEKAYDYMNNTELLEENIGQFEYSNYAVGILGIMLQETYDMTYDEVLKMTLCYDLDMTSTTTKDENLVDGYRLYKSIGSIFFSGKSSHWDMDDGVVAAGGIRANGLDMMKFLDAVIKSDLPYLSAMTKPLFKINDSLSVGMCWLIDGEVIENKKVVWHNGQTGGFNSYMGFVEEDSVGVFVLSNSIVNIQPLAETLLQMTLEK